MIDRFEGEYAFLSNFHPCKIVYGNCVYPSVEHFYQAMKTHDPGDREAIRRAKTAGKAKRLGYEVRLRRDWEQVKIPVMMMGLNMKFAPDTPLAKALIATHPHDLVEGNWWGDTFWGVCKDVGENHLGKLLVAKRQILLSDIIFKEQMSREKLDFDG